MSGANAGAIRRVGEAQAAAYHAQADVIGPDKVALIKTVDLLQAGRVRITPDTLVVAGGDGKEGASTMFSAYLATLLAQSGRKENETYKPSAEPDYVSSLTDQPPPRQDPSIPLPVPPAPPPSPPRNSVPEE